MDGRHHWAWHLFRPAWFVLTQLNLFNFDNSVILAVRVRYCNEPLDGLLSKKMGYQEDWLLSPVPLRLVNVVDISKMESFQVFSRQI